jgi:hypothetical protein
MEEEIASLCLVVNVIYFHRLSEGSIKIKVAYSYPVAEHG